MATNIETDLKEILTKIETKLDIVTQDVSEIKTKLDTVTKDVSEIKTNVAVLKANQDNIKEKLSEVNGSQKAQIWSLITVVTGAVITLSVVLFRKILV